MNSPLAHPQISEERLLLRYVCVAIIVILSVLQVLGWQLHWFAHPQKTTGLNPENFIEAQVIQLPDSEHLTSQETPRSPVAEEPTLHHKLDEGRKATDQEKARLAAPEHNVTKAAPTSEVSLAPTHGPVAVYTPSPVIPSRLATDELKRGLVIEFFITAQGAVIPRLLTSSDSEEVDAIAVETVKRWQFRPAEENHRAVDAKVRLKIIFELE